jgi:lysophospholipase L1-like esterase
MKRHLALYLLLAACSPALFGAQPGPFEKEIAAFEAADKTNAPPQGANLFLGSSSIRLWKSLSRDYPDHKVINRGFGGSQIFDSVEYADRIVIPYKPAKIFLYAGSNDINAGKSPIEVLAEFKAFVFRVRRDLPKVEIAFISIAPNVARWKMVDKFREANQLIRDYIKTVPGLEYIDVFEPMLSANGEPRPEILLADNLHMNEKGYAIWTPIIKPHLK